MKDTAKIRDSRFEILRILSMILIIMHHFAVHGGWPTSGVGAVNQGIINFFVIGGKLGVNIFILISGYFLFTSNFKLKKVLLLLAQILFFSITIYIILLSCGQVQFSWNHIKLAIRYFVCGNWFMPFYLILYCLSPFINIMIKNINSKQHIYLISFLLILQVVAPSLFNVTFFGNAAWFITLYLIAAYIKLYPNKVFNNFKFNLIAFIFLFILIAALNIFVDYSAWGTTHLACVLCAITMFLAFKNSKQIKSRFINAISSTTLGIYLIHDNAFFSSILWKKLLCCPSHITLPWYSFLLFAICCVIIIFVVCCGIDFLRQFIFNNVGKLYQKIKENKNKKAEK